MWSRPQQTLLLVELPVAERLARENAQKAKLSHLVWGPEMQPGQAVVDSCVDMLEQNVLVYQPPHKFVSRSQEIVTMKRDKSILVDAEGALKVSAREAELVCEVSTEYSLRQAWQRRSLAYDLAGLGTFIVLEAWVNKLFLALSRAVPAGYRPVGVQQLISADRALFIRAADNLVGMLAGPPGRDKPLDVQIKSLQDSPEIYQFMSPMPYAEGKRGADDQAPPSGRPAKRARTGKGKDKDGKGKGEITVPQGCDSKTAEGKPICFYYNTTGCSLPCKKGRCRRGYHVCWKKGCQKNHPAFECTIL